jgi:hypothetical protein
MKRGKKLRYSPCQVFMSNFKIIQEGQLNFFFFAVPDKFNDKEFFKNKIKFLTKCLTKLKTYG